MSIIFFFWQINIHSIYCDFYCPHKILYQCIFSLQKNIHTSHINIFIVNKYIFVASEYFIVNKYISIGNKYSCSKEIYFYIANKCFIVNKYILLAINILI